MTDEYSHLAIININIIIIIIISDDERKSWKSRPLKRDRLMLGIETEGGSQSLSTTVDVCSFLSWRESRILSSRSGQSCCRCCANVPSLSYAFVDEAAARRWSRSSAFRRNCASRGRPCLRDCHPRWIPRSWWTSAWHRRKIHRETCTCIEKHSLWKNFSLSMCRRSTIGLLCARILRVRVCGV